MTPPGAPLDRHDSVTLSKFLLTAAASDGVDPRGIARDAGLPAWPLAASDARVPSRCSMAVWELTDRALDAPDVAMAIAGQYRFGALDLYDYLFTSSSTLGDGLQASGRYLHFITTNCRLEMIAEDERETTYAFRHLEGAGRALELSEQFSLGVLCARARESTGSPVLPVHVGFSQRAPRKHGFLTDALGAERGIDFGQHTATLTFLTADLRRPVSTADPALADILRRYASTLAPAPPTTWQERFQQLLAERLADGGATLDTVARGLAVSPRTLQRRLAETGTTWRAELDGARRRHAERARRDGRSTASALAGRLGYSDPRSLRRALHRWEHRPG